MAVLAEETFRWTLNFWCLGYFKKARKLCKYLFLNCYFLCTLVNSIMYINQYFGPSYQYLFSFSVLGFIVCLFTSPLLSKLWELSLNLCWDSYVFAWWNGHRPELTNMCENTMTRHTQLTVVITITRMRKKKDKLWVMAFCGAVVAGTLLGVCGCTAGVVGWWCHWIHRSRFHSQFQDIKVYF